jgi:hypothetical protein
LDKSKVVVSLQSRKRENKNRLKRGQGLRILQTVAGGVNLAKLREDIAKASD